MYALRQTILNSFYTGISFAVQQFRDFEWKFYHFQLDITITMFTMCPCNSMYQFNRTIEMKWNVLWLLTRQFDALLLLSFWNEHFAALHITFITHRSKWNGNEQTKEKKNKSKNRQSTISNGRLKLMWWRKYLVQTLLTPSRPNLANELYHIFSRALFVWLFEIERL